MTLNWLGPDSYHTFCELGDEQQDAVTWTMATCTTINCSRRPSTTELTFDCETFNMIF
jgi:hypothetical protein